MISLRKLLDEHTAPAATELTRLEDDGVRCLACGHRCLVREGKHGVCQIRFNRGGELRVPFGYASSLAIDPIEKKPFYHAFPGRDALSLGMLGCNLHCEYCQNWITSQTLRDERAVSTPHFVSPERVVQLAIEHDCPVITSTYNEPLITSEWAAAILTLAKPHGIKGGYVSNGNSTPEVLEFLRPCLDLYKIDLKSFKDATYRRLGCALENVLDTIRRAKGLDYWVEIVTLVVPELNDSDDELRQMADFIASVSPEIPWHVTAFHPDYKLKDARRTPAETLLRAYEIGRTAGLDYVYAGNLAGMVGDCEHTLCPKCGTRVIERRGFSVRTNRLNNGACPGCGTAIAGVWGECRS
ncbi:MAG: AmmeMemoRadiSam system radical SAM enzyme [Phycisphaerae bacterium]|nr:AmmeMemoRadiSam system radical SAM enzyme [Phycisphaerae bacterium]